MIEILIATLATYALSTLIAEYDGPFDVFVSARETYGKLLSCNVCSGVWFAIAISIALGLGFFECLAVIGANTILARNT